MKFDSKYRRVRVFAQLVCRHDSSGKRTSIKQAWRVAGIATGEIEAIPDEILSWWWKIQDMLPTAGAVTGTAEKAAPSAQEPGPSGEAANKVKTKTQHG